MMTCNLMISLATLLMLLATLVESLNPSTLKPQPAPIHDSASAATINSLKPSEQHQYFFKNRRSTIFNILGCASSSLLSSHFVCNLVANAADNDPSTCNPPPSLLDARTQLDLAVQASSVQAWSDAAEIVQDESLDERNLADAFQNAPSYCGAKVEGGEKSRKQLETSTLDAISSMRQLLTASANKKLSTEDAMAVMKYGTSARVSIDSYFGL